MVATRARRASGEGTPRAAAPRRVSTRSTSPAPKKPAARARSPARKSSKNLKAPPAELSPYDMPPLEKFLRCVLLPLFLLVPCPLLVAVLAFATNSDATSPSIDGLASYISEHGVGGLLADSFEYVGIFGTAEAWKLLGYFNLAALILYYVPGQTKEGPRTATGHVPRYVDNGVAHCVLSSLLFVGGAYFEYYDAGILYDVFPGTIGALNAFGLVFCVFLYVKGLYAPSTADNGKSGGGLIFDYYWGTELYPRVFDIDIKKFVNCRFAMTYWQLAGLSFAYKSYTLHGRWDPGLVLAAVSQYLYLVKFFAWEIGYMRSIDIIVDRAGFYETWGCLVWVPCVYTLHSRCGVRAPTGLSWLSAGIIFVVGLLGVGLNFWADAQRMRHRRPGHWYVDGALFPLTCVGLVGRRAPPPVLLRAHGGLVLGPAGESGGERSPAALLRGVPDDPACPPRAPRRGEVPQEVRRVLRGLHGPREVPHRAGRLLRDDINAGVRVSFSSSPLDSRAARERRRHSPRRRAG